LNRPVLILSENHHNVIDILFILCPPVPSKNSLITCKQINSIKYGYLSNGIALAGVLNGMAVLEVFGDQVF
jgi:hypothetical protein